MALKPFILPLDSDMLRYLYVTLNVNIYVSFLCGQIRLSYDPEHGYT